MEKENKMGQEPQKEQPSNTEKVKDFDIMLEEVLDDLIKNNVSAEFKKEIKVGKAIGGVDKGDWL